MREGGWGALVKLEFIGSDLVLVTECPRPPQNKSVCREIRAQGIESLLVVDDDATPYPSVQPGGIWCYVRPLTNPEAPTRSELQRIRDFVGYERSHHRTVAIWIGYRRATAHVLDAIDSPGTLDERPVSDDPSCCRPYHHGCSGELVCHGTPIELAPEILREGQILSKHALTGTSLEQLARDSDFGEPPDYFDYVCLANGDCVAPDIVTMTRQASRNLTPEQCDESLYPGARFYFDPQELRQHKNAVWDGVQAIKVRDALELETYLQALVVPSQLPDGSACRLDISASMKEKLIYLDHREHPGLASWSTAAFEAAIHSAAQTERSTG